MAEVVHRGQVYEWMGVTLEVVAVDVDQQYAKLACTQENGRTWVKRQRLPLPDACVLVSG